jgi:hypothetical protein
MPQLKATPRVPSSAKNKETLMPDMTPDESIVLPPKEDQASVQAIITRGWNAYMVQVVLMKHGQSRELVGKEVTSYAVAEAVARVFAATHGVSWERVEVVLK